MTGDKTSSRRFSARPVSLICCILVMCFFGQVLPAQVPPKQAAHPDTTLVPDYLVRLALAPDGRTFAAGSVTEFTNDGALYVGDIETRALHWSAACHRVFALAFSPDGGLLATAHAGLYRDYGEVRIRNARTGKILFNLLGHRGGVQAVRFSTDGRLLATAGREVFEGRPSRGQIFVWDTQTGEAKVRIPVKRGPVGPVAFSQDNALLVAAVASWRSDSKIVIWSAQTGRLLREVKLSFGPIMAIDVSPDGKYLAIGSAEDQISLSSGLWRKGRITVLGIESGRPSWIYRDLAGPVNTVFFSADGRYLAATSFGVKLGISDRGNTAIADQKEWIILSADDGRLVKRHAGEFEVAAMAFSPDASRLITTGNDNRILVWAADGTLATMLVKKGWLERRGDPTLVDARRIVSLAFSPDGKYLASGDDRGTIKAWDVRTGIQLASVDGKDSPGAPAVFSSDGSHVVFAEAGTLNRLSILDLTSRKVYWLNTGSAPISCLAAGPGMVIGGTKDGELMIWDSREWKLTTSSRFHSGIQYVAVLPDPVLIVIGCADGTVNIVNKELQPIQAARLPGLQAIQSMALAPQLKQLAVASPGKEIYLLDLETLKVLRTMRGPDAPVESLAFSADSGRFAAIQQDGTLVCWNTSSWKRTWQIRQEFGGSSIAFSPNRQTLAGGSGNNLIALYDAADGRLLTVFK